MTASTQNVTSPLRVHTSTVVKSVAKIESQCAFSSSDSTGIDAVDEDGPWDETDPMFYEMHDDAMDF